MLTASYGLLVIAGEGPARRGLESMGIELGLREQLLFVDYLSRDGDLEDCYRAGDGFVFASRTRPRAWCSWRPWPSA